MESAAHNTISNPSEMLKMIESGLSPQASNNQLDTPGSIKEVTPTTKTLSGIFEDLKIEASEEKGKKKKMSPVVRLPHKPELVDQWVHTQRKLSDPSIAGDDPEGDGTSFIQGDYNMPEIPSSDHSIRSELSLMKTYVEEQFSTLTDMMTRIEARVAAMERKPSPPPGHSRGPSGGVLSPPRATFKGKQPAQRVAIGTLPSYSPILLVQKRQLTKIANESNLSLFEMNAPISKSSWNVETITRMFASA